MQKQKIFKFVFIAHVQQVTLALKFPCLVSITWRRGQKIAEVKHRKQIEKGVITFDQKLQLECNMVLDGTTRKFQQKKTKFTVLIFSDKGNKQAGQVSFDVSELLNLKQKEMKIEKSLQKCPDKNAKLSFTLTSYVKEQIQEDAVSQKSKNQQEIQVNPSGLSVIPQADFKKKKPDQLPPSSFKKQGKSQQLQTAVSPKRQNLPTVNKANIQRIKLQEQNRKLKQQLNQLQQLQIENATLRRRFEQAEKKSHSYYSKKLQEARKQFSDLKVKSKKVQELMQKKIQLQKEMCNCKQQMGRILNFAITSGNNQMTQQIYSIYQTTKS